MLLKGIAEEHTPVLYVRKGLLAQDIVMVESEALKKSDNVTIMQKIKNIFSWSEDIKMKVCLTTKSKKFIIII